MGIPETSDGLSAEANSTAGAWSPVLVSTAFAITSPKSSSI